MAKMFQVYGIGQALLPVLPPPLPFENPPTSNQTNYEIGQLVFTPPQTPTAFYLYAGAGNWVQFASSSGDIIAINGTANQVSVVTSAGTATVSLPSTLVAPGSITSTTTMTAGTGLTVTTGNATLSGTGSGVVYTPVVVGAAASPQTANGRVFSVTFSGVSIAAGATQSFVIDNTAVNTLVQLSMVGATAGSALSIVSVTNVAGTSTTIVVTNGTGATTSTANITFTGQCIN